MEKYLDDSTATLKGFWDWVEAKPGLKLKILKIYATIEIGTSYWRATRRQEFDQTKHYRFKLAPHCFVCGKKALVRHHIIALNNGGTNAKRNIVSLCHVCHTRIHPWLKNQEFYS